jgi:hypothetical protein
MTFRESETVELKSRVVDDIEKGVAAGAILRKMSERGELAREGKSRGIRYFVRK